MTKAVLKRFLKGMIAGAVSAMSLVTISQPTVWTDWIPLLNSLLFAALFGALTGLILALQKWADWK